NNQSLTCQSRNGLPELRYTIQHISIQNDSYNEIKDKPRNAYFLTTPLENKRCSECQRNNPKGTGQFNCSRHFQRFFTVCRTCTHHRTTIMNSNICPSTKMLFI